MFTDAETKIQNLAENFAGKTGLPENQHFLHLCHEPTKNFNSLVRAGAKLTATELSSIEARATKLPWDAKRLSMVIICDYAKKESVVN